MKVDQISHTILILPLKPFSPIQIRPTVNMARDYVVKAQQPAPHAFNRQSRKKSPYLRSLIGFRNCSFLPTLRNMVQFHHCPCHVVSLFVDNLYSHMLKSGKRLQKVGRPCWGGSRGYVYARLVRVLPHRSSFTRQS